MVLNTLNESLNQFFHGILTLSKHSLWYFKKVQQNFAEVLMGLPKYRVRHKELDGAILTTFSKKLRNK